jgi:hypothetical protein
MSEKKSKFCLAMIMRDEEHIITRALDSVKNIVSSVYIHDTGSEDKSIEVVKKWLEDNNVPGDVKFCPWKNFGHNRSELFKDLYNHPDPRISKCEYIFWVDCDEVLITNPDDPLSYPTKEHAEMLYKFLNAVGNSNNANMFLVLTIYGSLKYRRNQICRNNQLYNWDFPVHEILRGTESNVCCYIDFIYLLARKQGNSSKNPDRYKKDAEMFLEYLEEHPNEPRSVFYLAQTYESVDREKAIEWYKKRIELTTGYHDERYIACLRLGRIVTDYKDKVDAFYRGTQLDSSRLECYYELMMIEYNKQDFYRGYGWGSMAPNTKMDVNKLFVEHATYDYMYYINMSVCAHRSNLFIEAYKYGLLALEGSKKNERLHNICKNNMKFYEDAVKKLDLNSYVPLHLLDLTKNVKTSNEVKCVDIGTQNELNENDIKSEYIKKVEKIEKID